MASQVAPAVKNPPANVEDIRDVGLIPGSGRFRGGGHGNPLQYSFLGNSMDRRAWQATVHRVAQSQTQWKQFIMHFAASLNIPKFHLGYIYLRETCSYVQQNTYTRMFKETIYGRPNLKLLKCSSTEK